MLSESQKNLSKRSSISPDIYAALWQIINKSRMQNGWTTKTAEELDATIETWFESFGFYKIPKDPAIYHELYSRAFVLRADARQQGVEVQQMDAVLLASCWRGLKTDIEQQRIRSGKFLTENAASTCKYCLGTGWCEIEKHGAKGRVRCDHSDVEPLFG